MQILLFAKRKKRVSRHLIFFSRKITNTHERALTKLSFFCKKSENRKNVRLTGKGASSRKLTVGRRKWTVLLLPRYVIPTMISMSFFFNRDQWVPQAGQVEFVLLFVYK